jgi:predicted transcriptional regulator
MEEATVRTLWARYSSVGGIEKMDFNRYYNGRKTGIVLHVGAVSVFTTPLRLEQIIPGSHPPQSYRYLPSDVAERLFENACPSMKALG